MKVSKFIRLTEKDSAAIIQINRPNALNAINAEMYNNLYNLIKLLEYSKDVVIFKGSNKLFSAGGDMKSLSTEITRDEFSKSYIYFCLTFELITYYTKPFVVLVDGLALGGAATYAIPGKYRVCTENAIFSMPETAIGYFNDAGSSYFLSRLGNSFGVYMGMTGVRVKGFDMKLVGLSTHYVESSKLNQLEESLVNCKNHEDVERVLGTFSSSSQNSFNSELHYLLPKINKCFSSSTVEEIFDNLIKDGSDWALNTLKALEKRSPTALKVTHRSITMGRNLSLRDCLKMEFRLVIQHYIKSDLREGVRAVLVDKDHKPKWSRKTIYEVTNEDVERFFEPVPEDLIYENLHGKL